MRKQKHGVTEWQVDKAWAGYTIFCPQMISPKQLEGRKESYVYLLDMKGDIVHHWVIPGVVKLHGELLPNGNLLCSGTAMWSGALKTPIMIVMTAAVCAMAIPSICAMSRLPRKNRPA